MSGEQLGLLAIFVLGPAYSLDTKLNEQISRRVKAAAASMQLATLSPQDMAGLINRVNWRAGDLNPIVDDVLSTVICIKEDLTSDPEVQINQLASGIWLKKQLDITATKENEPPLEEISARKKTRPAPLFSGKIRKVDGPGASLSLQETTSARGFSHPATEHRDPPFRNTKRILRVNAPTPAVRSSRKIIYDPSLTPNRRHPRGRFQPLRRSVSIVRPYIKRRPRNVILPTEPTRLPPSTSTPVHGGFTEAIQWYTPPRLSPVPSPLEVACEPNSIATQTTAETKVVATQTSREAKSVGTQKGSSRSRIRDASTQTEPPRVRSYYTDRNPSYRRPRY